MDYADGGGRISCDLQFKGYEAFFCKGKVFSHDTPTLRRIKQQVSSYKSMEVPRYCQNKNTIIYFAVLIVVW